VPGTKTVPLCHKRPILDQKGHFYKISSVCGFVRLYPKVPEWEAILPEKGQKKVPRGSTLHACSGGCAAYFAAMCCSRSINLLE
jgi:hypothetical protein